MSSLLEQDWAVEVAGFEFDAGNVLHMAARGLTAAIVWEVWADQPVAFHNRPDQTATHFLIGEDWARQIWTVAILLVDDEEAIWRPITGWPSTVREKARWRDAN